VVLAVVLHATAQPPSPDASETVQQASQPAGAGDAGGQPIAFSHRMHTAANAIPCQFCHAYARRGPVAGVPSVERCARCHRTIAPEHPEIAKVLQYFDDRAPIPWVRVHDLPDFVRFTHKRHVLAGVSCETCHGDVAQMDAAVQVAPLTMGWCLGCHRDRQAPTDCSVCHY
jgi:hypothetical protein